MCLELAEGTHTVIYAMGGNDGDVGAFALTDEVGLCEVETPTTTPTTVTTTAPSETAPTTATPATPLESAATYTG